MKKIKIVNIINSLCVGGIENIVISLSNDLDKLKYDVTILVLSNTDNTYKNRIDKNVNIIQLPIHHFGSAVVNALFLCLTNYKIQRVLRKVNPDIVNTHIFFYTALPVLYAIKCASPQAKHFHTIHTSGLHYANNKGCLKIRIEAMCYKKMSSTLICVSKEVERNIRKLFPVVNAVLIPNYINVHNFNTKLQQGKLDDGKIRIIYPSRLVEGKNHATLLGAMLQLQQKHSNIELWLLGDGELREKLNDYVKANNLNDSIKFLGYRDDVAQIIAQCDIGVFPSQYEGFGLALIEMMAVGLPVICSDIPTFMDLSISDNDILFFKTLDAIDLSLKIEQLIDNPQLRKSMGVQSVNIANLYSREAIMTQYQKNFNI